MKLTQLLAFGLPLILILTTALVCYVIGNNRHLFIPISNKLATAALILPILTAVNLRGAWTLLKKYWKNERQILSLPLLALITIQIIYEAIIATLCLTYIAPKSRLDCALSERWQELFSSKNEHAIKTIQDSFNCCGLRTVRDRAWPFSNNNPSSCAHIFGRSQNCLVPWRRAEQINAGLLFSTIIVVFIIKVSTIAVLFIKSDNSLGRLTALESHEPEDEGQSHFGRLLIKDNNPRVAFTDNESDDALPNDPNENIATSTSTRLLLPESGNEWVTEQSNNQVSLP